VDRNVDHERLHQPAPLCGSDALVCLLPQLIQKLSDVLQLLVCMSGGLNPLAPAVNLSIEDSPLIGDLPEEVCDLAVWLDQPHRSQVDVLLLLFAQGLAVPPVFADGLSAASPAGLMLGNLYAVRRLGGHVTGVCGPIPKEVLSTVDLSRCQYGDPRRAGVRGQDFVPAERWMLGFENQAVILGALARARGSSNGAGERDEDLRLGAAAGALETGSNPGRSRQRGAALTAGAAHPLRGYPRRPHH